MICRDNTRKRIFIASFCLKGCELGYSASARSCELLDKTSDSSFEYVNDYK